MWPALAAAAIPAIAGIFSARSAEKAQQRANDQSQESAREQMAFQERMSSTAHQREVSDLIAAGLNPILSANAGASTPGGSSSTYQNVKAQTPERIINSARSFQDALLNRELIKTQRTQQALNMASASNQASNSAKTQAETTIMSPAVKGINAIDRFANWSGRSLGKHIGNRLVPRISKADAKASAIKNRKIYLQTQYMDN